MNYQGMYEKLQTLKVLNLLYVPDNISMIEDDFAPEVLHITNITPSLFLNLPETDQNTVAQIVNFYDTELESIISKELLETINNLLGIEEEDEFQQDINEWSEASIVAKPNYNQVSTLNAIKLWNYNHPGKKVIFEKMSGISIEVVYEKGQFKKAITNGKDVTKNAIYFNGMVKELDDPMDCIITGVVTITNEYKPTINSIIELEGMEVSPNVKDIVLQTKGRKEDLFECITFIADNIHITNIHHTGENVV